MTNNIDLTEIERQISNLRQGANQYQKTITSYFDPTPLLDVQQQINDLENMKNQYLQNVSYLKEHE